MNMVSRTTHSLRKAIKVVFLELANFKIGYTTKVLIKKQCHPCCEKRVNLRKTHCLLRNWLHIRCEQANWSLLLLSRNRYHYLMAKVPWKCVPLVNQMNMIRSNRKIRMEIWMIIIELNTSQEVREDSRNQFPRNSSPVLHSQAVNFSDVAVLP